jgi:hypothetical protein
MRGKLKTHEIKKKKKNCTTVVRSSYESYYVHICCYSDIVAWIKLRFDKKGCLKASLVVEGGCASSY